MRCCFRFRKLCRTFCFLKKLHFIFDDFQWLRKTMRLVNRSSKLTIPRARCFKPWSHRVSASASVLALMLVSMLENGYDTDAWCGSCRHRSMWPTTSVNADAPCDKTLRNSLTEILFKTRKKSLRIIFCILLSEPGMWTWIIRVSDTFWKRSWVNIDKTVSSRPTRR